jgi:uncharacterized membrane protein
VSAVVASPIPIVPEGVRPRIDAVDLLRGIAMVLMALGHVRLFLSHDLLSFYPRDLTQTHGALFLTQWLARFCAPTFFFVAGIAVFLSSRGKTKGELARFLLTRAAWLLLLELTVVKFSWVFIYDYHSFGASVLWTLAWSMVALAGLIWLPPWAVAAIGALMIATHNLFDGASSENFGTLRWLWVILHEPGRTLEPFRGVYLNAFYSLVPWIGVMAAGYGLGALLRAERAVRRKRLLWIGAGLTLAFLALRLANGYGDSAPWSAQASGLFTVFSFINCETFPPSLLHLLMTLGPVIILLALFDREPDKLSRAVLVFGRVPLFFYLLHIPLIHFVAVLLSYARYGRADWLIGMTPDPAAAEFYPSDYGYGLPGIYLFWLLVIALMFPLCRWFGAVKRKSRAAWLSYF